MAQEARRQAQREDVLCCVHLPQEVTDSIGKTLGWWGGGGGGGEGEGEETGRKQQAKRER